MLSFIVVSLGLEDCISESTSSICDWLSWFKFYFCGYCFRASSTKARSGNGETTLRPRSDESLRSENEDRLSVVDFRSG